jgi:site-specific recombinase XerD
MNESQQTLPLFSETPGAPGTGEETARLRPDSSLSAAIRSWGEALEEAGRSVHTVKAFAGDLRLMGKFVGSGQAINAIGTHDLKNFLDWILNKRGVPCSPKTYARRITSVKAFFRWLVDEGVLTENPAQPIPQQSVLSPLPEILSTGEIEAILQNADGLRHGAKPDSRPYTLVSLLLNTGIKKGECLAIHLNHIDLRSVDGPILFVRYGDVAKRYKERKLALTSEWVTAYQEYMEQYAPRDRLFPWSPRRLEYILEDLGKLAGLEKHLSFDMCRWSCALSDTLQGMEADKIRQKLGVSKIQWREIGNKLDRLASEANQAPS